MVLNNETLHGEAAFSRCRKVPRCLFNTEFLTGMTEQFQATTYLSLHTAWYSDLSKANFFKLAVNLNMGRHKLEFSYANSKLW